MTLKSLTLHRASHDNAGNFIDAGAEVAVGDEDNHIAADRARELLAAHGAQGHHTHADDKPAKGSGKTE